MQKRYRIIEGPESIQGSAEWLAFRKGKMSASMAASVLGIDPWRTRLQLFEEWMMGSNKESSPAMERGSRLEPVAREMFNSQTGMPYRPVVIQSISHPDFVVSLDGYMEDVLGFPHIIEIKCPNAKTHAMAKKGEAPDYYYAQMQMQMDVVGVNQMTYISFDGKEIVSFVCERNEEFCRNLFIEQLAFFAAVFDCRPPPATDNDWIEDNNGELFLLAVESRKLAEEEKIIKKRREEIKNEMQPFLTNEKMKVGGIKIQKVVTEGRIDYPSIPELAGVDLEKYRGPSVVSWRIQ